MKSSIKERRRRFKQLHDSGIFILPNPWDIGSARYLAGLGYQALATTSSGLAWSQGRPDNQVSRDSVIEHLNEIVVATDLPVNADFEGGFSEDASGVYENVKLACDTGIAGISVEDSTGLPATPLRDIQSAVERIRAARQAIDEDGGDVLLVGRAENYFVGINDFRDTLERIQAYSAAGADVLYAPGVTNPADISALVRAISPKPFNLLVGSTFPLNIRQIGELGVRRVSVGGGLARAAWGGFISAAQTLISEGKFDGFENAASGAKLNSFFNAVEKES